MDSTRRKTMPFFLEEFYSAASRVAGEGYNLDKEMQKESHQRGGQTLWNQKKM